MAAIVQDASPPTRVDWAEARLRQAILTGEVRPGEKLRAEQLAAAWGVSPTPLREAFQRLAAEGLVVTEAQRGARVAPIDADDAAELYELRLALEPLALRRSVLASDDAHRRAVAAAYEALARRHDTVTDFMETHRDFHLTLLARCPNARMLRLVEQLHAQTHLYQLAGSGAARRGDPRAEHEALRDAVLAGDAARAVRVLRRHLTATLRAVRAVG